MGEQESPPDFVERLIGDNPEDVPQEPEEKTTVTPQEVLGWVTHTVEHALDVGITPGELLSHLSSLRDELLIRSATSYTLGVLTEQRAPQETADQDDGS